MLWEHDQRSKLLAWQDRSRKSDIQIAELTAYFPLPRDALTALDNTTVGRALKLRPKNKSRVYSLLRVLAVFHLLGVATKDEIQDFFKTAVDIELPDRLTWQHIWALIEEGKKRYQFDHVQAQKVRIANDEKQTGVESVAQGVASVQRIIEAEPVEDDEKDTTSWESSATQQEPEKQKTGIVQRGWKQTAFFIALLLTVLALLVYLAPLLMNAFQPQGWCIASPLEIKTISARPRLYFDKTVRLDNFQKKAFYIYFNDVFVGDEFLDLEGFDEAVQRWVVKVDRQWAEAHASWSQADLWRVDYQC